MQTQLMTQVLPPPPTTTVDLAASAGFQLTSEVCALHG